MIKTGWYLGYRYELHEFAEDDACWVGMVYAPMWHPVRFGLTDLFVVLFCNEWVVPINDVDSFGETLDGVFSVAYALRAMQDEWDRLSPYEREYRIW